MAATIPTATSAKQKLVLSNEATATTHSRAMTAAQGPALSPPPSTASRFFLTKPMTSREAKASNSSTSKRRTAHRRRPTSAATSFRLFPATNRSKLASTTWTSSSIGFLQNRKLRIPETNWASPTRTTSAPRSGVSLKSGEVVRRTSSARTCWPRPKILLSHRRISTLLRLSTVRQTVYSQITRYSLIQLTINTVT